MSQHLSSDSDEEILQLQIQDMALQREQKNTTSASGHRSLNGKSDSSISLPGLKTSESSVVQQHHISLEASNTTPSERPAFPDLPNTPSKRSKPQTPVLGRTPHRTNLLRRPHAIRSFDAYPHRSKASRTSLLTTDCNRRDRDSSPPVFDLSRQDGTHSAGRFPQLVLGRAKENILGNGKQDTSTASR